MLYAAFTAELAIADAELLLWFGTDCCENEDGYRSFVFVPPLKYYREQASNLPPLLLAQRCFSPPFFVTNYVKQLRNSNYYYSYAPFFIID